MDASLHLSAVKPLGAATLERPDVPVGLSGFCGPAGHATAHAGTASADVASCGQPLTWQAEPDPAGIAPHSSKGPSVMLHGLQTKPMGASPMPAHGAAQVQLKPLSFGKACW